MTAKLKKKDKLRTRSVGKGELFVVSDETDGVGDGVVIVEEEKDGVVIVEEEKDGVGDGTKNEEGVAC